MRASFSQVEAGERERAAASAGTRNIDSDSAQQLVPSCAQLVPSVPQAERSTGEKRVGHADSDPSGQVVVTRASYTELRAPVGRTQRPDLCGGRDPAERFERRRDLRGGSR